ncbi:unnamed protein product [Rhizophagus irregularis]|nr:unnamed protein product [Rhizophagus irregularis]
MNADPNQRPNANELGEILYCWRYYDDNNEKYGYKGKEVKAVFEEADKEIQNISTLCEKDPDAIYTKYNKDCQDSQLIDLEVPSTSKLEDGDSDN